MNTSFDIALKSTADIENSIEKLNICMHAAVTAATSPVVLSKRYPCIFKNARDKLIEKRKLRKLWQNNWTISVKTKVNKITRELKQILLVGKNKNFQNYLANLTATEATDYSLWKAASKYKRSKLLVPPLRKTTGEWSRQNSEKALTFASHLKTVFEPPARITSEVEEKWLLNKYSVNDQNYTQIKNAKVKEVLYVINHLKWKEAAGYNGISGQMVKELPLKTTRLITIIINAIFRLCYFRTLSKQNLEKHTRRPLVCSKWNNTKRH